MRPSVLLTCATLALPLLSGPAHAQPAKPSLVVIIVVDQMRRDYIQDYKFDDKGLAEKPPSEWDVEMPHALQPRDGRATTFFYDAWEGSPYSDASLGRLAAAAIDGMKLGQGATIDFLAISFSALDIVGHAFGPRSHEIQDVLLCLDEVVGKLLDRLDKRVGRDKYVLAFTADHGVAVIPEQAAADGLDGGRIKMGEITALVNKVAGETLGAGRWVAMQAYSEFYFRGPVFEKIADDAALLASIKKAIGEVPGIARVYDRREVPALAASDDPLARAVAAGFFPARSGDLIVAPKPNWIFVSDDKTVVPGNGTTHGSGYPYDTQVPLILLGAGISSGHYEAAASPADIAPTLAALAGVALPTATGRTLDEALKK